jgi:hypothetical protein
MADAGRRPYTATLVQVGIAFGQMVGMFWKNSYKKARPAQYYPALMPVIPTPAHPSYPSNHSLQCHLILHCVLAGMPCNTRKLMEPVLRTLADRIALNREIAGVHFSEDTDAGSKLAERLFFELKLEDKGKVPEFNQVKRNACAEWNDNLKPGIVPDEPYPLVPFTEQVAAMVVSQLSAGNVSRTNGTHPAGKKAEPNKVRGAGKDVRSRGVGSSKRH